ncbi:hypothetical protein ES702_00024 [subsurface metagenome]
MSEITLRKETIVRDVVIASSHLWKGRRKVNLHFFAEHFLEKGFSVRFLTVLFSLLSLINPWLSSNKLRKLRVWLKGGGKQCFNQSTLTNYVVLSIFHPSRTIPLLNSYYVAKEYLKFSYLPMSRWLKEIYGKPVDILMFGASGISICSQVTARLVIYRLNDLISGFSGVSEGLIKYESEILKKADLVLPVSESLYDYAARKRGTREGVYLLPNGVDVHKFARSYQIPLEYKRIPDRIAIYVGTITSWFDWDLLIYSAEHKKDLSFVIIGPGYIPTNLPKNVYTFGPKPYEEIPAYMQHADVGLIPFKDLSRMDTVERPLKFYQYLASGLPVVSASCGALKKMAPYAILAENAKEFVAGIERALEYKKTERNELREIAKKFSWDKVFAEFDRILDLYL